MRHPAHALLAPLAAGLVLLAAAVPAQAQSYRYWGYYVQDGDAWTFAQTGPSETVPADGSVEGWRFAITGEASSRFPRAEPTAEELCEGAAVPDGNKAVGVVIDYGTALDAPEGDTPPAARGACAVVAADASGTDVLAAVAELRVGEGGFVCAIDGYPSAGCGEPVDVEAPTGEEQPVTLELPGQDSGQDSGQDADSTGTPWLPVALGVVAVGALGALAVALSRRRSSRDEGSTG